MNRIDLPEWNRLWAIFVKEFPHWRRTLSEWHSGQASAFYAMQSSGKLTNHYDAWLAAREAGRCFESSKGNDKTFFARLKLTCELYPHPEDEV